MNPAERALPRATLLCLGALLACAPTSQTVAAGSTSPLPEPPLVAAPATLPTAAEKSAPSAKGPPSRAPSLERTSEAIATSETTSCAPANTLLEVCRAMSAETNTEDCALVKSQSFAGVTVHELVSGFNPPLQLRKDHPRGLSGKTWFTLAPNSPTMLTLKWVLEIGERYFPLRNGYDFPDSKMELSFSQPTEFQGMPLLLVEEKARTGTAGDWMKTNQLTVIELSPFPRFVFHGDLSTVSHSSAGSTYEERRKVAALGPKSIELSERMGGMPGSMQEQEPPARADYCSGEVCPEICGEFPSERIGTWTEEEAYRVEVDGLHLTLVGRKGGRLECNNDRTMQAHLIGCAATGSQRSVDFAFDAGGDLRCGPDIPEYEFIHGGYFVSEEAKLSSGSTIVAFRLVNEPGFELTVLLNPDAMTMEVQTSRATELIEFGDQSSTDELFARTPLASGEAGLGYPFLEIDLTKQGEGCQP